MRLGAGLLVVGALLAFVAVVSSSSGSGAGGAVKSKKGPGNCRSFDQAPVANEESSEIIISVSGWIKCQTDHTKLVGSLYIWERQRGTGEWMKVGFARWGAINSPVARGGASARCFPDRVLNQFAVSMGSKVDELHPVVVGRNAGQYRFGKWTCPS